MSNPYYIHQMRHCVAHLLRSQPRLLGMLPSTDRPDPYSDMEKWSSKLPHSRLVRICLTLVGEAVRGLQESMPLAHEVLRTMVTLPGEGDVEDVSAIVLGFSREPAQNPEMTCCWHWKSWSIRGWW